MVDLSAAVGFFTASIPGSATGSCVAALLVLSAGATRSLDLAFAVGAVFVGFVLLSLKDEIDDNSDMFSIAFVVAVARQFTPLRPTSLILTVTTP